MPDKNRIDRRVERTQSSLWDAMFSLMHEKTWNEINVSKICKRANVARSSFYLHFQNKQELLDYGFELGISNARTVILNQKFEKDCYATLDWLTHHIYDGKQYQGFKLRNDEYIFSRFQNMVLMLFKEELQHRKIRINDHTILYVIGGAFSILLEWVKSDYLQSPKNMAINLNALTSRVF